MKVSESQAILLALKTDFEAFRAQRMRSTPFPRELRQAVLAAIVSGLAPRLVSRATGLSSTQLAIWQKKAGPECASVEAKTPPRILDVEPSPHTGGLPPGLHMSYEDGRLMLDFTF